MDTGSRMEKVKKAILLMYRQLRRIHEIGEGGVFKCHAGCHNFSMNLLVDGFSDLGAEDNLDDNGLIALNLEAIEPYLSDIDLYVLHKNLFPQNVMPGAYARWLNGEVENPFLEYLARFKADTIAFDLARFLQDKWLCPFAKTDAASNILSLSRHVSKGLDGQGIRSFHKDMESVMTDIRAYDARYGTDMADMFERRNPIFDGCLLTGFTLGVHEQDASIQFIYASQDEGVSHFIPIVTVNCEETGNGHIFDLLTTIFAQNIYRVFPGYDGKPRTQQIGDCA